MQKGTEIEGQGLLGEFKGRMERGVLEEQDLKELRRRCTEGQDQQNMIGQTVIPNISSMISTILRDIKEQRQEKKQSFFLQLLNNLVTNNQLTAKLLYKELTNLPEETVAIFCKQFTGTQKNRRLLLTFTYNILYQVKETVQWGEFVKERNFCCLVYLLVSEIYGQEEQEAFEWRTMLVVLLFNWGKGNEESTLGYLMGSEISHHQILQMVSILLEKVIDSRTTSTLVRGYSSTIPDIVEMYKENKLALSFNLNKGDIDFLTSQYLLVYKLFKASFSQFAVNSSHKQELIDSFQELNDIIELFGNLLFLGGYNHNLQQLFDPLIPSICQYFKIIYLLFKLSDKQYKDQNIRSYNRKAQQFQFQTIQTLLHQPQLNQTNLLSVYQSLYTTQMFALALKLLTNYIHINKEGLKYFQQNIQYLYMIMNLTKMSTTQATMREWSIMFIRNACEGSEYVQGKIGELNVELRTGEL